jgi:hypothetical protein
MRRAIYVSDHGVTVTLSTAVLAKLFVTTRLPLQKPVLINRGTMLHIETDFHSPPFRAMRYSGHSSKRARSPEVGGNSPLDRPLVRAVQCSCCLTAS